MIKWRIRQKIIRQTQRANSFKILRRAFIQIKHITFVFSSSSIIKNGLAGNLNSHYKYHNSLSCPSVCSVNSLRMCYILSIICSGICMGLRRRCCTLHLSTTIPLCIQFSFVQNFLSGTAGFHNTQPKQQISLNQI